MFWSIVHHRKSKGVVPAQFTLSDDGQTYDLSGRAAPLMEIMQVLKANNIAMHGTIDIRSNPAVREQVMEIVRNAVRVPDAAASDHSPPLSVSQRLAALVALRTRGDITDTEYDVKRQQIIAEL